MLKDELSTIEEGYAETIAQHGEKVFPLDEDEDEEDEAFASEESAAKDEDSEA